MPAGDKPPALRHGEFMNNVTPSNTIASINRACTTHITTINNVAPILHGRPHFDGDWVVREQNPTPFRRSAKRWVSFLNPTYRSHSAFLAALRKQHPSRQDATCARKFVCVRPKPRTRNTSESTLSGFQTLTGLMGAPLKSKTCGEHRRYIHPRILRRRGTSRPRYDIHTKPIYRVVGFGVFADNTGETIVTSFFPPRPLCTQIHQSFAGYLSSRRVHQR